MRILIYTVTLNPSLDYVMELEEMKAGALNRSTRELYLPGGKGINVSTILSSLGVMTTALGFVAGFVGNQIEQCLKENGINTDFINLKVGTSRINVKVMAKEETELNANGPVIDKENIDQLKKKLIRLTSEDMLVLSGSIPKQAPVSIYKELLSVLSDANIITIVDTTGETLRLSLEKRPFLIKPNVVELEQLFSRKLTRTDEIIACARELQKLGAKNVLVSMGAEGAILLTMENRGFLQRTCFGEVINSVGAGDSMIGGFLYGYDKTKSLKEALTWAVAAGSASAFSENLATKGEIYDLFPMLPSVEVL